MDKKKYDLAKFMFDSAKERVQMQEELERIFLLDWDDAFKGDDVPEWIMEMKDPQPFQAVRWLVSILSSSQPEISIQIPQDAMVNVPVKGKGVKETLLRILPEWAARLVRGPQDTAELQDSFGEIIRQVLRQNDQRQKSRLLNDMLYTSFVDGQVVIKAADLRQTEMWGENPFLTDGQSPFVFKARDPKTVFTMWDDMGLSAVLERYERSRRDIEANYDVSLESLCEDDEDQDVVWNELWTRNTVTCWVEKTLAEGEDVPDTIQDEIKVVLDEENGLGFIPYITADIYSLSVIGEERPVPLLYAGYRSNVFQRSSLFFTVAATLAFRLANPQWAQLGVPEGSPAIDLDFSAPHVYGLLPGQSIVDINSKITSDLNEVMGLLMQKSEETTVSKVIAGQSPGGVTAASGINLLTQGGKLQLVPVESAIEDVYTQIANMVFQYVRAYADVDEKGGELVLWTKNGNQQIDPATMPKWMDITTNLSVALPQDQATLYAMATNAWKSGLISKRRAWKIVGIENTAEEQQWQDLEQGMASLAQGPSPLTQPEGGTFGNSNPEGTNTQQSVPVAGPLPGPVPGQSNVGGGEQ